jgi:hypothetical protein
MHDKYQLRMQEAFNKVDRFNRPSVNCKILLNARKGDYLIKSTDTYWCRSGNGYVDFSYKPGNGWMVTSTRKQGLWCSKEEGKEILQILGKRYRMVKKSKNDK